MDKVRIHELAKVLNTNSKRIIEKLNEIDIHPKGAMSYLEPEEYNKLRQYLGMPPIESAGTPSEPVQDGSEVPKPKPAPKPKTSGLGQPNTIIKRRFINSESDDKPGKTSNAGTSTKRAAASSGLRTGFVVRDDEITYATGGKKADTSAAKKKTSKTAVQPKKEDRQEKPEKVEKLDISTDDEVKKIDNKTVESSKEKTAETEKQEREPDKAEIIKSVNESVKVEESPVNIPTELKTEVKTEEKTEEKTEVKTEQKDIKAEQVLREIPKEDINVVTAEKQTVIENVKDDNEVRKVSHADGSADSRNETQNVYKGNSYHSDRQPKPDRQSSYQNRQGGNQNNQNRTDRQSGYQNGQNGTDRQGGYQGNQNRTDRQGGYQGGQNGTDRQGGYQGNQNRSDRQGGYQGNQNRTDRQGGYQGNQNRTDRQGGYQGNQNRTDRQGNYQGGQGRQGSYQGGQGRQDRQGSYQGGQSRQSGYQGGQGRQDRQGSYQGSQGRQGGYQSQNRLAAYVPGKDDDDDRPAYQKKQFVKKDDKSEPTVVQKAEINARIEEAKKEAQAREQEKNIKRENKKESAPKGSLSAVKGKRGNKLDMPFVGEKKGVKEVFSDDFVLEGISAEDTNKFKKSNRPGKKNQRRNEHIRPMQQPVIAVLTNVTLPESMTVKELAESLKKTSAEIMKKMLLMGIMANVNQVIDFATAEIVSDEFGIKATQQVVITEEDVLFDDNDDPNDEGAVQRPPVVVVMGHVDHGKTSLLDAIRSEHVVTGEAGGITQHIGAYTVNINDRDITFLDTPGHEAFTAMRARGAQTTDIAILVVAADDGVMPQTVESINHAKAANVSVIIAVNKIDKQGANVDRVMQELTEYGLVAEEWGGDTIFVPVSAKKNENIDTLLEMILLTADVMELKANPDKQPKGTIIEAKLDKNRGPVATVLVQRGTLRLGDSVVTGTTVGRIRAMTDDKGKVIKEAGPSIPVEILGLPDVPQAGEVFYGITDEKLAKQLAEKRKTKLKEEQSKSKSMVSLDDLFNQIQEGNIKEINIIVKTDVQGSVEAVKQSLEKLSNEDVRVRIVHGAVGAVNESDISLAQVSNAMIIGFNVRPGPNVQSAAEAAGVDMRLYTVIYNAIEDVSAAMKGMLDPTFKETVLGHAEIRQIYKVSGIGSIAGCYITDGKVIRNSSVRIIRDGIVVHDGKLASLKRFKDDVKEVLTNYECGLSIEKFNDIKESDVVESYIIEEVKRD